jgi:hypothetical protein
MSIAKTGRMKRRETVFINIIPILLSQRTVFDVVSALLDDRTSHVAITSNTPMKKPNLIDASFSTGYIYPNSQEFNGFFNSNTKKPFYNRDLEKSSFDMMRFDWRGLLINRISGIF